VGDASMELPLPLVPVHTRTERRLLNQMMLRATEAVLGLKQLALTWVSSVDERDVYPKHETHLRLYVAQWERNSRARKVTEQAATGVAALRKFNAASPSSATGCSSAASVAQQAAAASTRGCPRAGGLGSGRWRHAHRTPMRWWSPTRQRLPTPGNANLASEVPTKVGKNDDDAAASAIARAARVAASALFAPTRARTNRASGQLGSRSRIRGSPSRPRKV